MVSQRKTPNSDIPKQRRNKIIHISCRSSSRITDVKHDRTRGKSRNTSIDKRTVTSVTVTKLHRSDHFSAQTHDHDDRNSNAWSDSKLQKSTDRHGMTKYHHRNRKIKKYKPIIISTIVLSLLLIIITIVFVFLLKSQSKTKKTPITAPILRWNSTGTTVAGTSESPGNSSNQLDTPLDVIFDYENNLYVADYLNHRVQKYRLGTTTGQTIAGTGILGSSPSQLNKPIRLVLDSNRNLYVSDANNHRIQFWPYGAMNATTVAGISNSPGNSSNRLNFPYGLVLHPTSGTLYIADFYNHRVMSYAPGSLSGTLVFGGRGAGTSNEQLYSPIGLHMDLLTNNLVVANYGAHNIVQFTLGASNWTIAAGNANGSAGVSSVDLNRPMEATFDSMNNMYVADRDNNRIQFYQIGQLNGTTIAGMTGVNDSTATKLSWPRSVRLDSQLNLYVADSNNHRIQKFLRY